MVRKLGVGLMVLAAAAACSDSTGPEDFNAVDTRTKADVVVQAIDNNAALQSIAVLGGAINFAAGAQAAVALAPSSPSGLAVPATAARLRALADAAPSFGVTSPLAIFPANLLGKTFVYNPQTQQYEMDAQATGAPANGVRLTLYAVDPILGQVVMPLNAIGYLDISDESTPSQDALHLVAVIGSTTYLDYVASAVTNTTTGLTLNAQGYVANGANRVDFDLTFGLSQSAITVDYLLTRGTGSIHLQGSVTQTSFAVTLTVDDGNNAVVFDVTVTPSTVTGSVKYNGDEAVTISGTPDAPVFTKFDGTPLTAAELDALEHLGDLIEKVTDTFDDLLGPAVVAFLL